MAKNRGERVQAMIIMIREEEEVIPLTQMEVSNRHLFLCKMLLEIR